MKPQEQHRLEQLRHHRLEADLGSTIDALFRRCPTLCGFSVRDMGRLVLHEVSVYPQRDLYPPAELCSEIVETLVALLEESPEVCELMRERTFARIFH